jgi:hypothetical protein
MRRILLAVAVTAVGACAAPNSSQPDRSGWPPVDFAPNPPAYLALRVEGRVVTFANAGDVSVWLSPPIIQVWHGTDPWTADTDVPEGTKEVPPGTSIQIVLDDASGPIRPGVTVWTGPSPETGTLPWFLWTEVPGAAPSG